MFVKNCKVLLPINLKKKISIVADISVNEYKTDNLDHVSDNSDNVSDNTDNFYNFYNSGFKYLLHWSGSKEMKSLPT